MRHGRCPQCNGRNIGKCDGAVSAAHEPDSMSIAAEPITIYACGDCRLSEIYLRGEGPISKPWSSYPGWSSVNAAGDGPYRR